MKVSDWYWFWKEFTLRPIKNKLICWYKGHDWVDCVSIAGGYTRSRWCRRCPKKQVLGGWVDKNKT